MAKRSKPSAIESRKTPARMSEFLRELLRDVHRFVRERNEVTTAALGA